MVNKTNDDEDDYDDEEEEKLYHWRSQDYALQDRLSLELFKD